MEPNLDPILQASKDLFDAGKTEEARVLLVQALKENPNDGQAWYLLSFVIDDPEKQAQALRRARDIDSNDLEIQKRLIEIAGSPLDSVPAAIVPDEEIKDPRQIDEFTQSAGQSTVSQTGPSTEMPPSGASIPRADRRLLQRTTKKATLKPRSRPIPSWAWLLLIGFFILLLVTITVGAWLFLDLDEMLYWWATPTALPAPTEIPAAASTSLPVSVDLPTASPTSFLADTPTTTQTSTPVSPTKNPTQNAYQPRFESASCTFVLPKDVQVDCGFIIVPEDRNGNLTRTIRLAVARYHNPDVAPGTEPVIYLQGGPGQEAIRVIADAFQTVVAPLLENQDVIIFDQRGMGQSQPKLDCPELNSLYLDDLLRNASEEERLDLYLQAFDACHDRYSLQGTNLAAYTTAASAADVRDILSTLGYERANLYGVSYGTRLALSVMRDYPELVRAAVLDSVQPREVKFINEAAYKTDYALSQFFTGCAEDTTCARKYPNLEQVFYQLVDQFNDEPIIVEGIHPVSRQTTTVEVDGIGLMNSVVWGLWSAEIIPSLPKYIFDIQDGDYTYLKFTWATQGATYNSISLGAMYSINCHEQIYATTPEELEADYAKYPKTEQMATSGSLGSSEALFSICDTWGAAPFDPQTKWPLRSSIPTLILAGEYDPATPVTFAEQVALDLSNSFLVKFPNMGHVPTLTTVSDCPRQIMLQFLDNPAEQPDEDCIDEMSLMGFFVPYQGEKAIGFKPFTDQEYYIAGEIPEGWRSIGSGYYSRAAHLLDLTQIGLQSGTASIPSWLKLFNDHFAGEGFDKPARKKGNYRGDSLYWEVYTASYNGYPVYLAFATQDNRTFLALMLCHPEEGQALYADVFLPVLDTVTAISG